MDKILPDGVADGLLVVHDEEADMTVVRWGHADSSTSRAGLSGAPTPQGKRTLWKFRVPAR
jgi:hypothetical protein